MNKASLLRFLILSQRLLPYVYGEEYGIILRVEGI